MLEHKRETKYKKQDDMKIIRYKYDKRARGT